MRNINSNNDNVSLSNTHSILFHLLLKYLAEKTTLYIISTTITHKTKFIIIYVLLIENRMIQEFLYRYVSTLPSKKKIIKEIFRGYLLI